MPVIRRIKGLLSCLLTAAIASPPAFSDPAKASTVEFSVWTRSWVGTLGSKQVEVRLRRVADRLSGSYCYQPCSKEARYQLQLNGRLVGEKTELTERDSVNLTVSTGTWQIESQKDDISGSWRSPDGKRTLPLHLRPVVAEEHFPYEVRLVADKLPEDKGDDCHDDPPYVSAIRLYKYGKLFQTLETDSQGTCSVFTPELIDANFDGWLDLTIAQFLPAGPNIPHQTWLYDKTTGRFVDAPPALQGITSAEFDPEHHIVFSYWRSSCCEHGVTTYRWKGGDLEEADFQTSYALPIIEGDKRRVCYITPDYRNGFIEFPSRVEQSADGQLKLREIDPKTCDEGVAVGERTYIDIWKRSPTGQQPVHLSTEKIVWKQTDTPEGPRYCPEVPFFDSGRITRILLKDQPDLCSEDDPLSNEQASQIHEEGHTGQKAR